MWFLNVKILIFVLKIENQIFTDINDDKSVLMHKYNKSIVFIF